MAAGSGPLRLVLLVGQQVLARQSAKLCFRQARSSDLPLLAQLVSSELQPAPGLAWWSDQLVEDDACFVACEDGAVVGVIATRVCAASDGLPRRGHISVLVVASHMRSQGCGSELLGCALQTLTAKGLGTCTSLYVRCSNDRAVDFYCRKHSFKIYQRVTAYYVDEHSVEDAFLLVRTQEDLHQQSEAQKWALLAYMLSRKTI
ncbi:MAG: hypothetical protein SGPRY_011064, partial [Prymnesium sp.]